MRSINLSRETIRFNIKNVVVGSFQKNIVTVK